MTKKYLTFYITYTSLSSPKPTHSREKQQNGGRDEYLSRVTVWTPPAADMT